MLQVRRRPFATSTLVAGFLFLASAGALPGATIHVPAEEPTIQAGIDAAVNGDEVVIAPGIYTGPGNINLDFSGKAITVRGSDPADPAVVAATIIDCEGNGRGFIFESGETLAATIAGLTIRNGGNVSAGSAVRIASSSAATIEHCTITGCSGGAVFCHFTGDALTLEDCAITGNSGDASGFFAGGVTMQPGSQLIATGCRITGNSGGSGGGIQCDQGSILLVDCTISGNSTPQGGGGLYAFFPQSAQIDRCVFAANDAGSGGGIFIHPSFDTTATIRSSIVGGNSAAGAGGGILFVGSIGSSLDAGNVTISGNSAGELGGALYASSETATIRNSILWGNTAPIGDELYLGDGLFNTPAATVTLEHSILEGGAAAAFIDTGAELVFGPTNSESDPALDADLHLSPGSVAVDGGDPGFIPEPGETDIDGDPRVIGDRVDIGADELAAVVFVRGDINGDGTINIADPISLLQPLFTPGIPPPPCEKAADANDDGNINIADVVQLLSALFLPGAPPPPPPHPECGLDPTPDSLDCVQPPPCP